MNIIDSFRLLKGYVSFKAQGGFTERFINLCSVNNIHIWNITAKNKEISANIAIKDFKKLKPVARASGVKVVISKKNGLPFFFANHSERVGLLISLVFFIAFSLVMNKFVWCIESQGSEKYSPEQIIAVAESFGLKHGTFIPFFDEKEASRSIVNAFEGELLWASVNIKGSRAMIEVRDFVKGIDEDYDSDPCNIVSDFDGVVLSVETAKGDSVVSPGSGVTKGDLLISGVLDALNESTKYCHARGKVTAITKRQCVSENLFSSCNFKFTKTQNYYSLYFFGIKIPLGFYKTDNSNQSYSYMKSFCFDGKILPFGIIKTTVAEYKNEAYEKEQLLLYTVNSYSNNAYSTFENTTILSSVIDVDISKDKIKLCGNYECIDNIGKTQPIIIENS